MRKLFFTKKKNTFCRNLIVLVVLFTLFYNHFFFFHSFPLVLSTTFIIAFSPFLLVFKHHLHLSHSFHSTPTLFLSFFILHLLTLTYSYTNTIYKENPLPLAKPIFTFSPKPIFSSKISTFLLYHEHSTQN
jgi:hypothetical protein